MTAQLAVLALALLTAALLWEDRHWRATHPQKPPTTLRCLCCEGAPLVEDIATHSRLAHRERATSPEDHPQWSQP